MQRVRISLEFASTFRAAGNEPRTACGLRPIVATQSLTRVYVGEPATLLVPVSVGTPGGLPELTLTRPDGTNYEVLSTYRAFVRGHEYVLYSAAVGELSLAGDWTLSYETGSSFVSPTYTFRVWRPS